jgi:hypothetical protein
MHPAVRQNCHIIYQKLASARAARKTIVKRAEKSTGLTWAQITSGVVKETPVSDSSKEIAALKEELRKARQTPTKGQETKTEGFYKQENARLAVIVFEQRASIEKLTASVTALLEQMKKGLAPVNSAPAQVTDAARVAASKSDNKHAADSLKWVAAQLSKGGPKALSPAGSKKTRKNAARKARRSSKKAAAATSS